MADDVEAGRIITRLVADPVEYEKGMDRAQKSTQQTAQFMAQHSTRMDGFTTRMRVFASTAAQALASLGITSTLRGFFNAFAEEEKGIVLLRATLQANGRDVDNLMAQYDGFISTMQATTVNGDDVTRSLLQQAESFGLTGDAAQRAAQMAISLAAITGSNATSMFRIASALAKGDIQQAMMFSRMIPQLRGIRDETEFVTRAQQLLNAGWTAAQAEAQSTSGQLQQLSNYLGDIQEDLGGIVAEGVMPFVRWMRHAIAAFQDLSPEIKEGIVVTAAMTAAITGLSAAIAIVGLISSVVFSPFTLLILGAGAAVAFLVYQFGGLENVMREIEGAVNTVLNIDPSALAGASGDAFDAGLEMGESFQQGMDAGTSGITGALTGSAEAMARASAFARSIIVRLSAEEAIAAVQAVVTAAADANRLSGQSMWTALGNFAEGVWHRIQQIAGDVWEGVQIFAMVMFRDLSEFIRSLFQLSGSTATTPAGQGAAAGAGALPFGSPLERAIASAIAGALGDLGTSAAANPAAAPIGVGLGAGVAGNPLAGNLFVWGARQLGIPGFQHGGFAQAGMPHIVGEAGPELFVPTASGVVVPLSGGGAGSSSGDSSDVTALLRTIRDGINTLVRRPMVVLTPSSGIT